MGKNELNSDNHDVSNPRVMKRCFMNGKRCIFTSKSPGESPKGSNKVFVIMPFTPNLKSYYNWKIKAMLIESFKLEEDRLQIADEVRNIGYIICGKICNKIQTSELILVDISLNNSNVFYELGLACGLERDIILMRKQNDKYKMNCTLSFFNKNDILIYSDINIKSNSGKKNFSDYVQKIPKPEKRQTRKLMIKVLSFSNEREEVNSTINDVTFSFRTFIKIASEVAIKEIVHGEKVPLEPWQQVMKGFNEDTLAKFSTVKAIITNCIEGNEPDKDERYFISIVEEIEESFCVIIDVSNNNPSAYFWLGYCHARGFNAIPVNKIKSSKEKVLNEDTLAFDLRALWYAEFDENESDRFKNELLETITHLLERDLPDWQRQAFWDRFPPESKLKVFMGAIHSYEHNREVVGDWDVRAVSELFSYLPLVRDATNIEIVTPLYSPEQAKKRAECDTSDKHIDLDKEFIDKFCIDIEKILKNSNAIVIASPDVNPVTEYLLHKIYVVDNNLIPFTAKESKKFNGLVAVKRKEKIEDKQKISRQFYREETSDDPKKESRGFVEYYFDENEKLQTDEHFEDYKSQRDIEISTGGFKLLGHLVVARHPNNKDNWVVILNGLSGPATFALSQILTGSVESTETKKISPSENLLKTINELLDESDLIRGVQAIISVTVNKNEEKEKNLTDVDTRIADIDSLYFVTKPKQIKGSNTFGGNIT